MKKNMLLLSLIIFLNACAMQTIEKKENKICNDEITVQNDNKYAVNISIEIEKKLLGLFYVNQEKTEYNLITNHNHLFVNNNNDKNFVLNESIKKELIDNNSKNIFDDKITYNEFKYLTSIEDYFNTSTTKIKVMSDDKNNLVAYLFDYNRSEIKDLSYPNNNVNLFFKFEDIYTSFGENNKKVINLFKNNEDKRVKVKIDICSV